MIGNLFKVAKREYLHTIKKPSFWISTIAFPLLVLGAMLLSDVVANYKNTWAEERVHSRTVLIVDELSVLDERSLPQTFRLTSDYAAARQAVTEQEAQAAINIPANFVENKQIEIFMQSGGIFDSTAIEGALTAILKGTALAGVSDPAAQVILSDQFGYKTQTTNEAGQEFESNIGMLVVPIAVMAIYIILVSFSTSYLLRSVSEEKENRMIEVVLTAVTPRQLVWGKVTGQVGIVFTQFLSLAALTLLVLIIARFQIPPEILNSIALTPQLIIFGILFIILGFLTLAGIMVIAASAVPTYREAQAFSTAFILIGIFPIYLLTAVLADPHGTLSIVTSLIPLTSPLVMIMRLSVSEINIWQTLFIAVLNFVYLAVAFVIAFKVFAWGALEYNRSINWRNLFRKV